MVEVGDLIRYKDSIFMGIIGDYKTQWGVVVKIERRPFRGQTESMIFIYTCCKEGFEMKTFKGAYFDAFIEFEVLNR